MNLTGNKFGVTLNATSRNLLLAALSTCKFTMLHTGHEFARLIDDYDLIDKDQLDELFLRIKESDEIEKVEFTLNEEILIYTALNITCKTFLTEIADDLQKMNSEVIRTSGEKFSDVRNTLLRSCQFVMEGMRSSFNDSQKFMERVILLDSILNVV